MLTRSGFTIPTAKDFHLAESWWAAGGSADATILPHADHLHVFRTVSGVQAAARLDVNSCANWPTGIEGDRKSTRLNPSHVATSYAVFCVQEKTAQPHQR